MLHELQVHQIELQMQNEELRRAHLELEESRDRYSGLYDRAPVGYLTLDGDGKIFEANLTAASLLGVERGRLLGMRLSVFMDGGDGDTFHLHRAEVLSRKTKQGCDLRMRGADGRIFPVHLDSVPDLESKAPGGRVHTGLIDLTELRHAQDDARTHASRTQTLLDTAADAIIGTNAQGYIESLNVAAEGLFGYREADVRGENVRILMPGPLREERDHPVERASREAIGITKDGTVCPIEVSVGEWWDHGERKLTAIIRDISARKQAERELKESEARFRQIAEHIEDVFYVREASGEISYVSPAYEQISGRPASEITGKGTAWLETIFPEDRPQVWRAWEGMCHGETLNETFRITRPDSTIRWLSARAFPVAGDDGQVLRDVGVVRDITSERALEQQLRQAQKMEAVGTLASGVAHNLRNVLQAVLAFIHIAQRRGTNTERGDQALERAVTTARRGASLTDQLMLFTRKQDAEATPLRIDAAVSEAASLLRPLVGEQILVHIETRAPHSLVMADAVELEQILLNLGVNARDAMPGGGVFTIETEAIVLDERSVVSLGLVTAGRYVKLTARDDGSGMDEATRMRIFEPFFTTKPQGKGTGLGLSTVFALTKQLGGCIDVASEKDHGTIFTLHLPCCDPLVGGALPLPPTHPLD